MLGGSDSPVNASERYNRGSRVLEVGETESCVGRCCRVRLFEEVDERY